MKILVCITDYATSQRDFLYDQLRMLKAVKLLGWQIDIFLFHTDPIVFPLDISDQNIYLFARSRNMGDMLTWEHRKEMVLNKDNYDIFIYTENDLAITSAHLQRFVEQSLNLPMPYVAGFIHYENGPHQEKMLMPLNKKFTCFESDPVNSINGKRYLMLSNKHQASYIVTRQQLNFMIDAKRYSIEPRVHMYGSQYYHFKETSASEPYTDGGLIKVVDLENIDDFLIHHMPNHYVKNAVSDIFNHPFYSVSEIKQMFGLIPQH